MTLDFDQMETDARLLDAASDEYNDQTLADIAARLRQNARIARDSY